MLSPENAAWANAFQKRYGRVPRVLHIGNIANNAYNNSKLLNQAGLQCDVICYDYYHSMGAPEWEDADLVGVVKDDFSPDWFRVCSNGYQRPRWFVQGPFDLCVDYLCAKNGNSDSIADFLWRQLTRFNKCRQGTAFPSGSRELISWATYRVQAALERIRRIGQALGGNTAEVVRRAEQSVAQRVPGPGTVRLMVLGVGLMGVAICRGPVVLLAKVAAKLETLLIGFRDQYVFGRSCGVKTPVRTETDVMGAFSAEFPDRHDVLTANDVAPYVGVLQRWKALFLQYDFVIAYSTDPILPMLCGNPYFAFEHGTIRDIPYQKDATGRLTALAYRLAEHVFVTNFDCRSSAEYLAPGRYTLINHPYDEDHGLQVSGADQLRAQLCGELDSDLLLFHPTRQDWVPDTGYADKSNDVFLRAFAGLRQRGCRVGLICCEWGGNVEQSRALLDSLGVSKYVKWIPPQAITPFERYCMGCDIVVDQFKLGAFGGVVFKAMAVGAPILTYLDIERLSAQYPLPPPVINCRTQGDIIGAIEGIFSTPQKLESLGTASRAWMKQFHSKHATINAQVDQFRLHSPQ